MGKLSDRLKRCEGCAADRPLAMFPIVANRRYRRCSDCHKPRSARRSASYYRSPEYKRACRARKAAAEGRIFRPSGPGGKGQAAGYAAPVTFYSAQLARAAWAEWVAKAPAEWLAAYSAAQVEAKRRRACQKAADYRRRFPERERERIRKYKHSNPERAAAWGERRWQRIAQQADGTVSAGAVSALLRSRRTCPYCRAPITPETAIIDHIIPVALGGLHGMVNLVACCATCNAAKGARDFEAWLAMLKPRDRQRAERLYTSRFGPVGQGVLV